MAKGNLIFMIGVPGSGKSTLASLMKGTVVSSDAIRGELFGSEDIQYDLDFAIKKNPSIASMSPEEQVKAARFECNKAVFGRVNYLMHTLLKTGDVICDATNIMAKSRKNTLEKFKGEYDKAFAFYLDVGVNVAKERNRKRSRHVPDEVIDRMAKQMQVPTKAEGFDGIFVIR